jgi:hypothetical protein
LSTILSKIFKLAKLHVNIAILNASKINDLSKEEAKNIMSKVVNGEVVIGD